MYSFCIVTCIWQPSVTINTILYFSLSKWQERQSILSDTADHSLFSVSKKCTRRIKSTDTSIKILGSEPSVCIVSHSTKRVLYVGLVKLCCCAFECFKLAFESSESLSVRSYFTIYLSDLVRQLSFDLSLSPVVFLFSLGFYFLNFTKQFGF